MNFMGKMVIFNSYVTNYQAGYLKFSIWIFLVENPELFKDSEKLPELFCENGGRATSFFVRTYVDGKQTMVVQFGK